MNFVGSSLRTDRSVVTSKGGSDKPRASRRRALWIRLCLQQHLNFVGSSLRTDRSVVTSTSSKEGPDKPRAS